MSASPVWHEDDGFWEAMAPLFFGEKQWAAAPIEAEQAVSLLGAKPGASILDLCCGPGRHSLELARRGFHVTGVDKTGAYLEEAKRRARGQGLAIDFMSDDMRRFRRPEAFDGAVNLSTSFGYFLSPDEDRQVVENLRCSLKDGAALVVEMMSEAAARRLPPMGRHHLADGTVIHEERRITRDGTWFEKRRRVISDGRVREFHVAHRLYSAARLSALLDDCGFGSVDTYGSLAGAPFDEDAEFLVAVARR